MRSDSRLAIIFSMLLINAYHKKYIIQYREKTTPSKKSRDGHVGEAKVRGLLAK